MIDAEIIEQSVSVRLLVLKQDGQTITLTHEEAWDVFLKFLGSRQLRGPWILPKVKATGRKITQETIEDEEDEEDE